MNLNCLSERDSKVIAVKYRGEWVVVDNGYHNWSVTVPPFTNSNRYDEIRWSEWIESMRKDVEVRLAIFFYLHYDKCSLIAVCSAHLETCARFTTCYLRLTDWISHGMV
jgi:hypothetical protein